jgi:hypothetical protein
MVFTTIGRGITRHCWEGFISEDPLGFAGSGPNLYAYVFNSPINLADPSGLSALPAPVPGPLPYVIDLEGPAILGLLLSDAQLLGTEIQTIKAYNSENAAIAQLNEAQSQFNQVLLLSGRYTQRDLDHDEYKDRCGQSPPPGLGSCEKRIWELQRDIDCRDLRWKWDKSYQPGRHANDIANLNRTIKNGQSWIDKNCK